MLCLHVLNQTRLPQRVDFLAPLLVCHVKMKESYSRPHSFKVNTQAYWVFLHAIPLMLSAKLKTYGYYILKSVGLI